MRFTTSIIISIMLAASCDSTKIENFNQAVLEYSASTRGFYLKVVLSNQMVNVSKERNSNTDYFSRISTNEWTALEENLSNLNLDILPALNAPSERRFSDGAAIAIFKITYDGKIYETTEFDHGNPPQDIKNLVENMISLKSHSKE